MFMKGLFGHTGELWPVFMGPHSDHVDILRLSQNIGRSGLYGRLEWTYWGGLACVYAEAQ